LTLPFPVRSFYFPRCFRFSWRVPFLPPPRKQTKKMAQKIQVLLVCDLHDGDEEGTETVTFGLDGTSYEIDVCDAHGTELRDAFAPYIGHARRAGRAGATTGRRRAAGKGGAGSPDRVTAIREWSRKNGHKVSERGRLSASLVQA